MTLLCWGTRYSAIEFSLNTQTAIVCALPRIEARVQPILTRGHRKQHPRRTTDVGRGNDFTAAPA
jgi:hypothetical protein